MRVVVLTHVFPRAAADPLGAFLLHLSQALEPQVEPMVVALPSEHPFAVSGDGTTALSLKALAGDNFIVYARQQGPAIYEATMAACLKAGFSPNLGQEAPPPLPHEPPLAQPPLPRPPPPPRIGGGR